MIQRLVLFLALVTAASAQQYPVTLRIAPGQTTRSATTMNQAGRIEAAGPLDMNGQNIEAVGNLAVSGTLTNAGPQIVRDGSTLQGTGIITGGTLSVNGGDPTKFDVAAGHGIVVDNHTDPENPVLTEVVWGAFTAQTPTFLAVADLTFIAIDSAGAVVQSVTPFTFENERDLIVLGFLVHIDNTTVEDTGAGVRVAFNQFLEYADFVSDFGPFNVTGNTFGPNGANLNIDKSTGQTYGLGSNYANNKKQPSVTDDAATVAGQFRYTFQDGSGGFTVSPSTALIVPGSYDDGDGTLGTVGATQWTAQRIFLFAQVPLVGIHYGQELFVSKAAAMAGLTNSFVTNPVVAGATFRGWVVVRGNATDLSDTAQAEFVAAGRFGLPDVISGGMSGEANTASNANVGGVGVFKQKTGVDLEFRGINAGSSKITSTLDTPNNEIDIDLVETAINHDNLLNFVANKHIDHSAVTLTAGSALSGGGNITANRTFDLDITELTADANPDEAADYLASYDASATANKKILIGSIDHDNLTGFVANKHIDHSAVSISSGTGLTGGGNITTNRTLSLDINGLTADATPDGAADFVATYDASAAAHKKVLLSTLGAVISLGNASATATADYSATPATDTLIGGMTVTPAAGTYWCIFNTSGLFSTGAATLDYNIYVDGAIIQHSDRTYNSAGGGNNQVLTTNAFVTVNGAQAIEARWRITTGTPTLHERSLNCIRVTN